MSSILKLNQDYVSNTLIPNYAAVAFQTELGGNSVYLSAFSYAGGKSTYSFGLFQYDVGAQGVGSSVHNFLTSIGFNATQISQLSQQGGLDTTTLSTLNTQLSTALHEPANQSALDQLNINWSKGLVNQLQNSLDVIYQKNPAIALQIYGSQELQLRLIDYANQFGLSSSGSSAYMTQWLSGQAVTMASDKTLSLTTGQPLDGAQIDNFIMNTRQGVANLNDNVTTRLDALDSVAPVRSSSSSAPIFDVDGIPSPVVFGATGTGLTIPGQTPDPGLPYYEINSPTETGRLYDNGVLYTKDTQTGGEFWSVPTATGGVVETTQFPGGEVTSVQYIPDPVTGNLKLNADAQNVLQFIQQQELTLLALPPSAGALDLMSRTYASIGAGLDATAAANALAELVIPYSATVVAGDTPEAMQAASQAAVERQKIVDTWKAALAGENTAGAQLMATSEGVVLMRPDGTWIAVSNKDAAVNTGSGGVPSAHPSGAQTLGELVTSTAATLIDALTLIKAIQTGKPLPIVTSGLRLVNDFTPKVVNGKVVTGAYALSGAASVGSSILSVMSLDAALKRGDTLGAIAAGAQALGSGVQAYVSFAAAQGIEVSSSVTNLNTALSGTPGIPGPNIIAVLNLVNCISQGDEVGAAMSVISMTPAAPIAYAYYAFQLVSSLFGGSDAPPEAWGSAHPTWSGFNAVANATGAYGGLETATQTYNSVLSYLDQLVAQEQAVNPGSPIGIVANRLPSLSYRNYTGYSITDIDPLTGEQRNPGTLYDLTGRPYNAPAGSVQASQSLSERMIRVALERGAVAPLWEVQTAALQTQMGDPMAGLTEEERAGRAGLLAPSPQPSPASGGGSQMFRAVALDLNGDGVQTTGAARTVAFDVDDSGYLKNTAWLNNSDGFLFLDRNLNGQIDAGSELFSNSTVALSERGLAGMRWIDSNYDGSISALDPVWNELKVWQDANGNGTAEAGETKTLAQLGITSLNYAMGTFERNGQLSQLSSPDLAADTEGTRTHVVPEGIIIQTSNGHTSLLATRIDDKSAIEANRDGVTGYEDTELIISAADLLANDTLAGFSGNNLSITGVSGFTHGSGFLDGNGFVHYTPEANYYGAAQFDYTIRAATGQTATASVDLTLQNVNDAPVATLDQHLKPVYGYTVVGKGKNRRSIPQYAPYVTYDYSDDWSAQTVHDTIVGYGDPNPNDATILVTDPDDPAGSFTFEVSAQAQKGEGTVDANGNIGYINWVGPNMLGTDPVMVPGPRDTETATYPTESDPFTVRVTDPHGASATVQIDTIHSGSYNPSLGSGGGGGKPISVDLDGNGFQFTNVDDSNVFFDINGDGWKHRMAWVAPGDGLLAFDADGNGLIDNGSEISFAGYQPDAQTDLEGLRAFDTNNDGFFSALDAQWGKFGVWQDTDQDGITDAGEFKSLDELGIASVNLTSNGQFSVINGQTVHGIGQINKTDGSTLNIADVTLQYSDEVQITNNADGTVSVALKPPFAPNGEVITGTPGKDLLLGNNGNTIIEALAGDDVVMSDIGNDVIDAGSGNDIVYAGGGNDLAIGGAGDDVVFAGLGNDVVLGGDGHDALFGEGGNDVIFGGNGNDLVAGGDGNNVLSGDAGDDQVYGGTGNDALFGGEGNDELAGMEGYDRLDGGAGNDLLDGGAGNDTLFGGTGNDTYLFGRGSGQDTISDVDATAGNIDTVRLAAGVSAADVKITRDVDNLYISINGPSTGSGQASDRLTLANWFAGDAYRIEQLAFAPSPGSGQAGTVWDLSERAALLSIPTEGDDFLVGSAGDDFIEALGGNDTLAGGAGNDYLQGGSGNDTYLFGRGAGQDYVYEYDTAAGPSTGSGQAGDTIKVAAGVNPADVKVTRDADNLCLSIKGTADKITVLDWFGSDAGKVERVEFADGAVWDVAALATKAADSTLTGDGGSTILGTAGNDTLVGNALNNLLDGGVGGDTMIGGAGDDTYIVDNAGDLVIENPNEGNDSVHAGISYTLTNNVENLTLTGSANLDGTGNVLDNLITGNNGNNLLDGGYGADTLSGGRGDDTYVVDSAGDIVIENPNAGTDTVLSGIGYKLTANVENLTLTGSAGISGTGNVLDNVIAGNSGNNRIDGGAGADTMLGGAGNDTYVVDGAGDAVMEEANAGFDTVQAGFDYTLGDNVESLLLAGTGNINGTGNAQDNLLTGNAGNNVLDGGAGQDAMLGGAGDDTYIVDNTGDRILEDEGAGIDTVRAGVTYTLAAEIENMVLTGTADIGGTGNELDNIITGNSGNNRIDGGLGADAMAGGAGNDTYVVDEAGDAVTEGVNAGIDTVESGISYTLGDNVENLTLTGADAINGTGNALDNTITGNAANNVLDGAAGADAMAGGAGDDTYIVDNAADVVVENLNEGTDVVFSSVSYGLSANVENLTLTGTADINGTGNVLDNVIIGNGAANILSGLDGNDTLVANGGNDRLDGGLGADTMLGGAGDDTYVVESSGDLVIEAANSGIDTVESSITYTLTDNVENLILTGPISTSSGQAAVSIDGTGNALDNLIVGNSGNNRIDGGLGADTMLGGAGDDTYVVDNIGDLVIEDINAGTDTVESSISYMLTDNVENLTLTGIADINGTGNMLDNIIVGNDAANILSGLDGNDTLIANGGNDRLDGGLGADTMLGGAGDDTYVVDNIGDLVIENPNAGTDTVESSISYTLTDNVENMILTGTDAINGTGNVLDNVIVGNDAANILSGLDGNDTLTANGGNDRLDGGTGADTMLGGAGDDTYVVESSGDLVIEAVDSGIDTVESGITYTLTDNVENLILTGVDAINGTGNVLDNIIVGNDAANILSGLDGNDTLTANGGNDLLDGGTGADTMLGGLGDDKYVVESSGDLVIEAVDSGIDTVESGITYTLTDNVENLILTGVDAINGTGNVLDNIIVGNDAANILSGLDGNDTLIANAGNDMLDGGTGADTMLGGAGDDTYVVDNLGDLVVEDLGAGTDQVFSSISYTLTDNVENLTLTGAADINGTGNVLDNVIVGNDAANILSGLDGNDTLIANAGNDLLDGGLGADIMLGGVGDDTYVVDNVGDLVVEDLGAGTDQVFSSISYTLTDNVENLTLTGIADINGTGNVLDNIIIGNSGNNILSGLVGNDTLIGEAGSDLLDGGLGADTMLGGTGDDTYVVDNIGDLVTEDLNAGIDHVLSGITYTLTDNVENLTLTGTADINGTGNALDNVIIGNSGNNILIGLEGNDVLDGGLGSDVMIGGIGNDTYVVDNIGDRVVEEGDDEHDDDDEKCALPEYPAGGIDTVRSSITYTLGKHVENLVLTGSEAINGTGNDLDNILIGNTAANVLKGKDGNDTLIGNGGMDTLIGGEGDDTYVIGDAQSVLVEERKEGIDTVVSSVSYVLKNNFENLTLTGTQSLYAIGNDLDNVLTGNDGNNILSGGDGDDTLDGGRGIDTLIGGEGDDLYLVDNVGDSVIEGRNDGEDTVRSTVSYMLADNVENLTLTGTADINGTGNALDNVITGNGGANVLFGLGGNDTLQGNAAGDILQGGDGNDILRDNGGNNLLDGGRGADSLSGNAGNELFAGGTGNDVIRTGDGADVILFNRGDGRDAVYGGIGTDNTLSLGGNIRYKDIALSKVDDDLILEVGDSDQITFKDWYETDTNYKSVLNLQVVTEAMAGFDAGSSDPLLNQSVQQFDFTAIVNAFDQARGNKSGEGSFRHWSVMNTLLDAHLAANDAAALGGDLAYQYGKNGTLAGISQTAAQTIIGATQFGNQAQAIGQLPTIGSEVARLG